MVFKKIKNMLEKNDEKYEILHHRYSKLKLENKQIEREKQIELENHKDEINKKTINELLKIFKEFEELKSYSSNLKTPSNEIRNILIKINKIDVDLKNTLEKFNVLEFTPKRKDLYDKNFHEVIKYESDENYEDGEILKCCKSGFKYNTSVLKKAKVIVNKKNN